ncbi:MAG: hypothetical protein ACKO26_24395 [Planctomycetota bacterium]
MFSRTIASGESGVGFGPVGEVADAEPNAGDLAVGPETVLPVSVALLATG